MGPLLGVLIISIKEGIKNIKNLNTAYVLEQFALALALGLSWMSGYVLFATSSMAIIVVICMFILSDIDFEKS